jgi:hypothetical protein
LFANYYNVVVFVSKSLEELLNLFVVVAATDVVTTAVVTALDDVGGAA